MEIEELTSAPTRYGNVPTTPSDWLLITVEERLFSAFNSPAFACANPASAARSEFWAVCKSNKDTTSCSYNSCLLSAVKRAVLTSAFDASTFAFAVSSAAR